MVSNKINKNIHCKLAKLEKENWYFRAKRNLLKNIFNQFNLRPNDSLDVGAGVGANFKLLKKFSKKVDGVECSKTAIKLAKKRGLHNIYLGNALTFNKSKYDFVLCSDIIEHVDDYKLMKNLKKITRKGSHIFITVPAFMFLWGNSDILAHHYKRYTMKQLINLISQHSFKIIFINYWGFFALLPNLLYLYILEKGLFKLLKKEKKGKLLNIPKWLNKPLYWIMKFENKICMKIPLPWGVNIIALIAKK